MRCYCCNRNLNDYESTLKSSETGEYLDTCVSCLDDLGVSVVGREDLNPYDMSEEVYDEPNDDE